jgi:hypothetical protein
MLKIPDDLKDIIFFKHSNVLARIPNAPLKKNSMKDEFMFILNSFFKTFVKEDWTSVTDNENVDHVEFCICSHSITILYYILHIPSGIEFQVGCDCVKKIDIDLYFKLIKDKCIKCENVLKDKRKVYQKDGYCCQQCYLIDNKLEESICDNCSEIFVNKNKYYFNLNGYCSKECFKTDLIGNNFKCFFKKYKDEKWKNVIKKDPDYCKWNINNNNIKNEDLKNYIIMKLHF